MLPRARFLYALSAYSLRHEQSLSDLDHQGRGEGGGKQDIATADSPSDFHGDRCATCALPAIHGVCWLRRQTFSMTSKQRWASGGRGDDLQPILDDAFRGRCG